MESRASNQKILSYFKEILKKKDVIEDLDKAKQLRDRTDINSPDSDIARDEFEDILENICHRYQLPVWTGSLVLERLVIEGLDTPLEKYQSVFSTCGLGVFDEDKKLNEQERRWLHDVRPIKITVSPHASIEDIKKYVDQNADEIKLAQARYKGDNSPLNSFYARGKEKQAIYDYIFENQHLTYEELTLKLNKKFKTQYSYDTVGRMVRRENEKRGYEKSKRTN